MVSYSHGTEIEAIDLPMKLPSQRSHLVATRRNLIACLLGLLIVAAIGTTLANADHVRQLQVDAMANRQAEWGHWGADPEKYNGWGQHSNRLIPIYTFGMNLDAFCDGNSVYRNAERIKELYGQLPAETHNPDAEYFDQTDVFRLQQAAIHAGKKHIFVLIFDGMDWQTTQAAAIYQAQKLGYTEGRGTGLSFLDTKVPVMDYGYFVTSPHNEGTLADVDTQTVSNPGGRTRGGFATRLAGPNPWTPGEDRLYIISQSERLKQAYTDSASSATSMFSGIKTYNGAINTDFQGHPVTPISRDLQEQGFAIGVVTSVPVSHATPGSAYANNVYRYDYQDIARDLLGLRSISHPEEPLPGVDVLIGAGWGGDVPRDKKQGENFEPGNQYLTDADIQAADIKNGGRYEVFQRIAGVEGREGLLEAAEQAAASGHRLLGYVGSQNGHLPFATADGQYNPVPGLFRRMEEYTPEDLRENPTLADMTEAALKVLENNPQGFWLMVEAGDVDWANHDNNIDASIGAVKCGDKAFEVIIDWINQHDAWDDSVVIVTADHGHYMVLEEPSVLIDPSE